MGGNRDDLAPIKRERRPVGEPSGFICHLASDSADYAATALRLQVLVERHQVDLGMAGLIAALAYGEARS
jgi:hypothetical protein